MRIAFLSENAFDVVAHVADPVGGQRGHARPPSSGKVPQILDQTSPESGQRYPICIKVPHGSGQKLPTFFTKVPQFCSKTIKRNYHLNGKFRNSLGEHQTSQLHGIFCKSSLQMRCAQEFSGSDP